MDLNTLENLGQDPDIIPGIHNYCDRWCERCYLSSRCMVFKMENFEKLNKEPADIQNKDFWEELSDSFSLTKELLVKLAEEKGLDLEFDLNEEELNKEKQKHEKIDAHPLAKTAHQYFKMAHNWLENRAAQSEEIQLDELPDIDEIHEGIIDKHLLVKDLVEIISCYHTMIPVKIKRALSSSMDNFNDEDPIQNDYNGTAKLVLNCIERSVYSWTSLMKYYPEDELEILNSLAILQKLNEMIRSRFPDANKFIRPGFDEIE